MKIGIVAAAAVLAVASPAAAQVVVNPQTIGARVIVNSTDDVIASFMFSDAANSNQLFLEGRDGFIFDNRTSAIGSTVNLGSFAVGTELIFRLFSESAQAGLDNQNYFTGPGSRNPDGIAHAAASSASGFTFVGFEDKFGGGDRDYNDLWFRFTNVGSGAVPEPASWAMMIAGIGIAGGALRRRRSIKASVRFA